MANLLIWHNLKVRIARALAQWGFDAMAFTLAYVLTGQSSPSRFLALFGMWSFWVSIKRSYTGRVPFWTQLFQLLKWSLAFTLLSMVEITLAQDWTSIGKTVGFGAFLMVLVPAGRWVARFLLSKLGLWSSKTIIFGTGENAQQAAMAFRSEPSMGYSVKAFVQPLNAAENLTTGAPKKNWPVQENDFVELRSYHCVIALEANQSELRDQLIRELSQHSFPSISVIPSMRGVPLFGLQTTHFFSHELLMIELCNNLSSPLHRWTKRTFDLVGAATLILLLSPLLLFIAYKIWRCDGAPVVFSQQRVGRGLKTFKFYKFRSMVKNAENLLKQWEITNSPEWREYTANNFKLVKDSRLIDIGALIRRTSIDELPQLFNVLMGDMSLVGPRPLLPRELPDYGDDLSLYAQTSPGLTGLWQVSGRSETSFDDRIAFDVWYVKNWSIWTDVIILFRTWSVVFRRKGAF